MEEKRREYEHEDEMVQLRNDIVVNSTHYNVHFPPFTSIKTKFEIIHKAIDDNHWNSPDFHINPYLPSLSSGVYGSFVYNLNLNKWVFSIQNNMIEAHDLDKFEQVLLRTPPPLIIHLVRFPLNHDADNINDNKNLNKILHDLRMNDNNNISEDKLRKLEQYLTQKWPQYNDILSDVENIANQSLISAFCENELKDRSIFKTLRGLLLNEVQSNFSMRDILHYHNTMLKDIKNKNMVNMNKMEHESNVLIEVIISFSEVIKEHKYNANPKKLNFWEKYAELCLLQSTIRKCISLRVPIRKEFYQSLSQNLFDLSMVEYYVQLTQIINKYNNCLHESNRSTDFNKFLSLCSEKQLQQIQVFDDMIPKHNVEIDKNEHKEEFEEYEFDANQPYKIYFLSPYKSRQTFVALLDFSDEYLAMQLVVEKNKYLWYLDVSLPASAATGSRVRFRCVTDEGTVPIMVQRQRFSKNLRGFYYVLHERNDDKGGFALFNRWDIYQELRKASANILQQLTENLTDWKSYNYSLEVLLSFRSIVTTESIWKKARATMMKHNEIKYVFVLQLLYQKIRNPNLSLNTREMYRILEILSNDASFNMKLMGNDSMQRQIGIALYRNFAEIVHHISSQRRSLTSADYILLYPIFNFFCYFENMIRDNMRLKFRNYRQYDDFFLHDKSWNKVNLQNVLNIDLDMESPKNYQRVYPFENILFRLCSIQKRHKSSSSAVKLFKSTLKTIARREEQMESIYIDIFNNDTSVMYIFDFISDHFNTLWKELIVALDEKRIASHNRILSAFHHHLEKEINRMNNKNNHKVKELYNMITNFASYSSNPLATDTYYGMKSAAKAVVICNVCNQNIKTGLFKSDKHHCKFCGAVVCSDCSVNKRNDRRICDMCNTDEEDSHNILDTINMRLALLQNTKLIQFVDAKQYEYNLYYMLRIVLRGNKDGMDPNIMQQLITFMHKLLMNDDGRNIVFHTIQSLMEKNQRLSDLFKEAMKRTLSSKLTLPKRICMFLECEDFYKLHDNDIHQCFINKLAVTEDDDVQKWNPKQIQNIQNLAQLYAIKNSKVAIHLWNEIFNKLIRLPIEATNAAKANAPKSMFAKLLPIYSGQVQEQKVLTEKEEIKTNHGNIFDEEEEDETGQKRKIFLSSGDLEINPKNFNINEEKEKEEEINPFFMTQLQYCISMAHWNTFAVAMKHIASLRNYIEYVQKHLSKLNGFLSSKSKRLTMKHLEIFTKNKTEICKIANDCEYSRYFDQQKMNQMINEYQQYTDLKLYFIRFLARFTKQNEDAITKETDTFVLFIKNWDTKLYSQVKSRKEWNKWLQPNAKKLAFLFEYQTSNVFFNIWCGTRRESGNNAWNINNYMNTLYPKVKREWDHLITRASESQLTFNDVVWFQQLDLIQELNIMQLEPQQVLQIQNDIHCSLCIDDYVDFIHNLTKVVDIFILNGKTQIIGKEDENWDELQNNLNIAKSKMNDKSQSITDIAQLFSTIAALVGVEYDPQQKQWIGTVVVCKETIHRMANDDHFKKERFRETLQLLDDSNDGEMTQLSGSLRSTHALFVRVWNQSYKTRTDLMRFFASVELKLNDIYNLRQIHDAIPRIKNIVAEVGKMAKDRDMQKLDSAMSRGYFIFDTQNNIQASIMQSKQIETDQVAKQAMHLDKYNVAQIQGMIDIILLCRNKNNVNENVIEYIRKIDICKEISEWRIKYILKGGRMRDDYNKTEQIKASSPIKVFNDKHNEWKKRVLDWSEYVLSLRNDSHLFNYFTINQIRIIINKLNVYKLINMREITQRVLFQELMGQFRFVRPELNDSTLRDIIDSNWKTMDENSDEALIAFNRCFNNESIINIYDYCTNNNKSTQIAHGVSNLLITKERSEAIFAALHLYSDESQLHSHQVLLCNKSLSSEDVFIFIFRCLQNEKRFKYNRVHQIPVYCLLFPEDLDIDVLDKTVLLFNQYLLSKSKKTVHYSLIVISCKESITLCHRLAPYRTNLTFDLEKNNNDICSKLFAGENNKDILKNNKPFVQLYKSPAVGYGKSYMIKQMATKIQRNSNDLIRIPFNSPDIDLDFVVNRLYKCHALEGRKIIYHLDISSSASNSVNYVLFSLLFLRYIRTPRDRIFSVQNNMAFLIEVPTDLASLKHKEIEKEFYILHPPKKIMKYAIRIANHKTNPFLMNEDAHYAAKFLYHFYSQDLKKDDPDPISETTNKVMRLNAQQIHRMMGRNFPQIIRSSPIRQKSFWEYLYTQFVQVANSTVLRNEWHKDNTQHFNQWKHLVTESIIDLAEDFSKKLYTQKKYKADDDERKYIADESDGTEHFHLTQKWQRRSKPIVLLNQSVDRSISFLVNDVNQIQHNLKQALDYQKFDLLGWQQQNDNAYDTKQDKIRLLLNILGTNNVFGLFDELISLKPYCDYALTFDNMLKMIAIFFRVKADIPVILMGETGCGKTCLLSYLAKAANIEIERADVHGGFTAIHIRNKMNEWIEKALNKLEESEANLTIKLIEQTGEMKECIEKQIIVEQIRKQHEMQQTDNLWIFFDEINTSKDIGYFKEIVCDGYFDGNQLPKNMKVIAACNPYRRRKIIQDDAEETAILNDPLSQYMYRVYPLPSTMKQYVWMFGSLSARDEAAYTYQMTQTFTQNLKISQKQIDKLSDCIVVSQIFVRKILRDSAMVSLRDIARCLKIFIFLYGNKSQKFDVSMIEALALVYYFRLNDEQRSFYSGTIAQHITKFSRALIGQNGIIDKFCEQFKDCLPRGIALNRSLKENLFLLFICIQTKTPLILVGKPGSSKTLAMSIIRDYLSDYNREILAANNLLPIHVVSFQCSAQSRAEGIEQRWQQTQKAAEQQNEENVIYVLLLDEIGLAEHSQYRPLKVLHQLLEIDPPPISFIGLSNWKLDASKMNRAICHLCPIHKIDDLNATGRAMANAYTDKHDVDKLHPMISLLSSVYSDVMQYENYIQPRYDFFGARDFYSVVRHFLTAKNSKHKVYDQNEELIMYFLRNFGGINYQRIHGSDVSKGTSLYNLLCKHMALNPEYIRNTIYKYPPHKLIELNLSDKRSTHELTDASKSDNFMISRHIMAITEYYNSWNILLDLNIINYENIFIFGSEFERDKSNIYLYLNKVKNCMETGKTLILCNLDEIHESLYDMLNQRYTFVKTSNKMYCRIALGSNSQTCFVDPSFKCIVISTKFDAHRKGGVPIAFLNRFEKQLISYQSSLTKVHKQLLKELRETIYKRYSLRNIEDIKDIFAGFCNDTLSSLILNKVNKSKPVWDPEQKYNDNDVNEPTAIDDKEVINKCMQTLLDVTLPEALIQSAIANKKQNTKNVEYYLPTLQSIMEAERNRIQPLLIILTYDFAAKLETNCDFLSGNTIIKKMSEFSKSEEFEDFMDKYLNDEQKDNELNDYDHLLLQYKHKYDGMNHFMHIKHIIEAAINKSQTINKKITILVHLRRSTTSNKVKDKKKQKKKQYATFPLILSESSKTVFLDSLSQKKPIELNEFANQTIKDICEGQGIDLLKSIFQRSLSHLVFAQKIDVENEIQKLSQILDDAKDTNVLQKCILNRFIKLISDNKINRNIAELVGNAAIRNTQWSRGSFYERLYDVIDTICVVAMMRVLQTLYENNNIDTIYNQDDDKDEKDENDEKDEKEIHKVFIELYSNFDLIEIDSISTNIQSIVENRPDKVYIKYDYSAKFPFSKTIHNWCNSQKTKLNIKHNDNANVIHIAQNLRREMNSSMPEIIGKLSTNMIELYAYDMIFLYAHQLQIDKTWQKELLSLIVKYIIASTMFFCGHLSIATVSIAELEIIVLYKHEFIRHLIKVTSVLDAKYWLELNDKIKYEPMSVINIMDSILDKFIHTTDDKLSQLYQVNSIHNSMKYMIQNMNLKSDNDLYAKCNACHIKHIALKNKLKVMHKNDINTLFGYNCKTLCNYNTFHNVLLLLMRLIPNDNNNNNKEQISNQLLHDLLTSIDHIDINKCNDLLNYAQFLINLLCKNEKIIGKDAKTIKWNKNTEYEVTKQLFLVLSHDSMKTNKLIKAIQNENSSLAAMIIQSMHSKDGNKKRKVSKIKHVPSDEEFNKKLTIRAPLIRQFNPEIYDQAYNSITIKNFFTFFQANNMYPILSKFNAMNERRDSLWNMHFLPDIAQWIKLTHSKYMGTLSESACKQFMINDVFKQCKLHKWGDANEWKQLFKNYRDSMNQISFNPDMKLISSDVKTPISASLIANKCAIKQIKNSLQSIRTMIKINNYFTGTISVETKEVPFFDLRKEDLIDTQIILEIIKKNSKLWICYDPRDKTSPETYIIFDLERIEHEIQNKCVFGRKRLRIKYNNFQFVGSKNMLQLIQSIKLKQEILNYEIWHLFDKQFESNIQRKRALNVVEDVIALVSSSKGNIENNDNEFYDDDDVDDDDDDKDDEKETNPNLATQFMNKVFASNRYNEREEIWHFMKHKLKIKDARCNLFRLELEKKIQLKHIQSLWNQLIKRIDGEMVQYEDKCYICYESIQEMTPIALECCGLNLHYECLKEYIQSGFGNNGTRITLKQLSCLMCRNPMKHKAANQLFRDTQILYDKVKKVALNQLQADGRSKDPQIKNRNGEFYGNPAAYAMKLYAFFLCYRCKHPYFFGAKQCGDNMQEQSKVAQRVCDNCSNDGKFKKYKDANKVQNCPKCKRAVEKSEGCDHITCICGAHWCYICAQAFSPETIYTHIGTHTR